MCLPDLPTTAARSTATSGNVPAEWITRLSLGPTKLLKNRVKKWGWRGAGFPSSVMWLCEFDDRQ